MLLGFIPLLQDYKQSRFYPIQLSMFLLSVGWLDTSETNIEEALQIAASIVDRKKATRIVLLSDGLETKGNVSDQLVKLSGTNVSVDVVPLTKPFVSDVSIESFVTPQIAYAGEQQQLVTEINLNGCYRGSTLFI